jgi:plasmid stabilization system protein ParE
MPKVRWRPEALADLELLLDYLKSRNERAALRAGQVIDAASLSLADSPYRGVPLADDSGRRKLVIPFGKSAYLLHYIVDDNSVVIVRVYHGRQNRPH